MMPAVFFSPVSGSNFYKKAEHGCRTLVKMVINGIGLSKKSPVPHVNFSGKVRPENDLFHI